MLRVLGVILVIVGLLIALLLMTPLLLHVLTDPEDTATKVLASLIVLTMLGGPSGLLIFYGLKLYYRKKIASELARQNAREMAHSFQIQKPLESSVSTDSSLYAPPRRTYSQKHTEQANRPISRPVAESPSTRKTVICPNCGASQNMISGQKTNCEYCDTVLS